MSFFLVKGTPPKFNIAPEKWWLEDYFWNGPFFRGYVKLRGVPHGYRQNGSFSRFGTQLTQKGGDRQRKTRPPYLRFEMRCEPFRRPKQNNGVLLLKLWRWNTPIDPREKIIVNYNLLGQWLNFKLFGVTYLVGKIKFKLFFSGSIGWVR